MTGIARLGAADRSRISSKTAASFAGSWRSGLRSLTHVAGDDADAGVEPLQPGRRHRVDRRLGGAIAAAEAGLLLTTTASRTPTPIWSMDDADVVERGEVVGFAGLGGDVADVDHGTERPADRLRHALDQQVGQDAGVEAAGTEDDQVGVEDAPAAPARRRRGRRGRSRRA